MSRLETAQFAEDFELCPALLRRMDVMYAFKHSDRPDYGGVCPFHSSIRSIGPIIDRSVLWSNHRSVRSLVQSSIGPFIGPIIDRSIHRSMHWFIHSSNHSSTHPTTDMSPPAARLHSSTGYTLLLHPPHHRQPTVLECMDRVFSYTPVKLSE